MINNLKLSQGFTPPVSLGAIEAIGDSGIATAWRRGFAAVVYFAEERRRGARRGMKTHETEDGLGTVKQKRRTGGAGYYFISTRRHVPRFQGLERANVADAGREHAQGSRSKTT